MPKKIDPKVKERCTRLVLEHLGEYPSLTAACESVARREGIGAESVRRWVRRAQVDTGHRQGATSQELAETIYIDEDNDVRVGYRNPYDGLSIPGLHADALSWAAEAKKMGQAEPSTKGGPLVEGSHLTRLGWLTGLEPATPATTTRCSTN